MVRIAAICPTKCNANATYTNVLTKTCRVFGLLQFLDDAHHMSVRLTNFEGSGFV